MKDAKAAAMDLISIPSLVPVTDIGVNIRGGGIQDLNDDYNYTRTARYTIIVPVEIDGKETARVTAPYTRKNWINWKSGMRGNKDAGKEETCTSLLTQMKRKRQDPASLQKRYPLMDNILRI